MILKVTGIDLKGLQPTDWNHANYGLTDGQSSDVWKAIADSNNFWTTLSTLDSTERLPSLHRNHELTFITNRATCKGDSIRNQTAMWLGACFNLEYPTVIVAKNKGEVAKALGIDVFIDDNVPNCKDLVAHGIKTYLMDAPYNQECGDEFPRVEDFDDFVNKILVQQS